MKITGRLTGDAKTTTTKTDKQVVNFSIAINDSYKAKGSEEFTQVTTYVNCAYWLNAQAGQWLKKGVLVELEGRIGLNVYNNMEGKATGALTFNTSSIVVLAFPKAKQDSTGHLPAYPTAGTGKAGGIDDLPF
jgi:single-strand DNA-binding protein